MDKNIVTRFFANQAPCAYFFPSSVFIVQGLFLDARKDEKRAHAQVGSVTDGNQIYPVFSSGAIGEMKPPDK